MRATIIFTLAFLLFVFSFFILSCDCGDDDDDEDDETGDDDATADDDDDDDAAPCDGCLIDEVCFENGEENPDNGCEFCDVANSDDSWSDNDGADCDDGDFCNGADSCSTGSCSDHSGDPCETYEECSEILSLCYNLDDEVFILEGEFQMGCEPGDTDCYAYEEPRHEITLSAYLIGLFEVTNDQFADFLTDHGNDCDGYDCADIASPDLRLEESGGVWTSEAGFEDYPIVEVSWYGAKMFCEWGGGRLPTEAQWEKAGKGASEHFIYPWGDTWEANASNWEDSGDPYDNGPTPVGYYDGSDHGGTFQTTDGRSPYGLHDMAGNVWEWVNDWYSEDYYSNSPTDNPPGPETGTFRVLRGGSWGSHIIFLRNSLRSWSKPESTFGYIGFRCVRD